MIFSFLKFFINCELFELDHNETINIQFVIERHNISNGYFQSYNDNSNFQIKIVGSEDSSKIFYDHVLKGIDEPHFSFSTKDIAKATLSITNKGQRNSIYMKYETKLNTFDSEISRISQIEPAVYALNSLLAKINDVIELSKTVGDESSALGSEHRYMVRFIVFLSLVSMLAYLGFNVLQTIFMKRYLNRKKLLFFVLTIRRYGTCVNHLLPNLYLVTVDTAILAKARITQEQ